MNKGLVAWISYLIITWAIIGLISNLMGIWGTVSIIRGKYLMVCNLFILVSFISYALIIVVFAILIAVGANDIA